MLKGRWLPVALILLASALVLREPSLLVLAVLFFLVSAVARLWSRFSLWGVSYRRILSSKRAFFGETITLQLSIANNKFLPLPRILVEEEIPADLLLLKGTSTPSYKPTRSVISSGFSLGWYRRLTRRYPLQCLKRGDFAFGPTAVETGDPFGFLLRNMTVRNEERLLVYPPVLPVEELGIPSRHPFGDLRAKQHLFEDPVQVVTTRDYATGDPLKRVHWRATARLQRMQSRVFEKTTSVDLALFLDTRTVSDSLYWATVIPDLLETAIIVAASVAADTINKGNRVGFYANEYYRNSDRLMRFPPSRHPDQLRDILEALARVRGLANVTADRQLAQEAKSLAWETTIVLITAAPTDEVVASLKGIRRGGRRVTLILIGSGNGEARTGDLPAYHVSEDVYREHLAAIKLEAVS